MLKAVENIKTKCLSLRVASRAFGIPASTLSDKCSGRMPLEPTHFTLLTTTEAQELTLPRPQSLVKERALVTPAAIANWFDTIKTFMDSIDPKIFTDGNRVYNADESGFAFDPRARKVVTFEEVKNVYKVTSNSKAKVMV
ncbi:hypothetical protein PoB_004923100 [Plakobranchus ocellatus]|uniref:HTH psq-type domain-containing protein n=1 Tax=Plakobranchus ocellatus TaxID=259542 RepID=A0AAV4BUJ2_9GAST|nr:hypothetical protein PoB_004923100 [Plakobranchus ocellatus]